MLGVIYGFFACLLCKITTFRSETLQLPVVFGFAYLSFVNTQYVSWSWIMAIIGYGIVTKRYTFQNLSCASRDATKSLIKVPDMQIETVFSSCILRVLCQQTNVLFYEYLFYEYYF